MRRPGKNHQPNLQAKAFRQSRGAPCASEIYHILRGEADTVFRTVSGIHLPEAQPSFYSSPSQKPQCAQPTLAGQVPRGLLSPRDLKLKKAVAPQMCISLCFLLFAMSLLALECLLPCAFLTPLAHCCPCRLPCQRLLPAPTRCALPSVSWGHHHTVYTLALRVRFLLHTSCPCSTMSFSRAIPSFIPLNNIPLLCQLWHFMAIQKHLIS